MRLQKKVFFVILIVWTVFCLLLYLGSKVLLVNTFLLLERDSVYQDLQRVKEALNREGDALANTTSDYATWNDMYSYMQGENPAYVVNNMNLPGLVNINFDLVTYWNIDGKLVVGASINSDKSQIIPYPEGLEHYIYPGAKLFAEAKKRDRFYGFGLTAKGLMVLASNSLKDSDGVKKSLGTLISGRDITPDLINKISNITKLKINLFLPQQINSDPELKTIYDKIIASDTEMITNPINDESIEGYLVFRDLNGKPISLLYILTHRAIYTVAHQSLNYFIFAIIIMGIVFAGIFLFMIRILIIKRLENLSKDVLDMNSTKNHELSRRVKVVGNDELSIVSSQLNHMMDIIQSSHSELEKRVDLRTNELVETNKRLQNEIKERKVAEVSLTIHKENLMQLAHFDSLTKLPNRVYFNTMLSDSIADATRLEQKMALLFLDLDGFKKINDGLGHHIGDLVLTEVAKRFRKHIRDTDVLARLGGDEFIILLKNVRDEYAQAFSDRILEDLVNPVIIDHHEFFINTSIGISIFPDDGVTLTSLQKNADMAMYKSKKSGGQCYSYYTQDMELDARSQIELESNLRRALKNNEFILYFQPKINLDTEQIIGVEALIRWNHPTLGLILPDTFIPIAEETGLIISIGEWVLREACKTCKAWIDEGLEALSVAINISAKQFQLSDIANIIKSALEETGLPAKYLQIEVTETAIMMNLDDTEFKLKEINKMGVKIAIDDFGVGYTSISHLKRFPVHYLKIDRVFINGIPQNKDDLAIVRTMIVLSQNLDLKCIAEGVETQIQVDCLKELGCHMGQGYFFSRPLSEKKLALLIGRTEERES
ncbi:MAG: EAL domain-containing protein [Legionella sp.]|nr:MAG: EAL domain-containing protein [Legionella sp.]